MFECNKCGQCCKHLNKSEIYADLDRGDGVCKYLVGNICSIYKCRPLMCRVDKAYEEIFKNYYSREEYYKLNYNACKMMQKKRRE